MHTDDQLREGFHEDGYLHLRGLLPTAALDAVRAEIGAEIDRRACAAHAEGRITDLHGSADFERRYGLLHAQDSSIGDQLDIQPLYPRSVFALMQHPALLAPLTALLGPAIDCNPIQHLRPKPPTGGDAAADRGFFSVPWHQDSGVTTGDADASTIITCWIPVGDATEEMGCLRVIPGIHEHLPHIPSSCGTTIDPDQLPQREPVILPCTAGDVIMMHQFTPHHSTPNRSDRCRWSLDLRFQRHGTPSGRAWFPSWPVQGVADAPGTHQAWMDSWEAARARPNPGARHRVTAGA